MPSQPQALAANGNGIHLEPWRNVIHPNPDVLDGSFQEADFAASLQSVYDGTSTVAEYSNPPEFFRRTHPTAGLRNLLVTAMRCLSGNGGNPVIQTKTGFGGGKTHSLIALYHLVNSNRLLLDLPNTGCYARVRDEIRAIMEEAGVALGSGATAKTAVLSGVFLAPDSTRTTDAGDPLNTLWGEMAYQLGGQPAYETVGHAARNSVAPGGEALGNLFQLVGPCVILMDEIVNYARNANLDAVATFLQNLTEAVAQRNDVVLVASLPSSPDEAGGDAGVRALDILSAILERSHAAIRVAETSNDEAFAVVRRRLFREDCDEAARDATCRAFQRMYQRSTDAYPQEAREARYLERLRQCYPIHPEIFDRLYEDWSPYHEFQRTRGVLRLMAQTISRLCADGNAAPLIMPGDLPFGDGKIANVFTTLLGPQWDAATNEVDGENSRTRHIDLQKPARYGAVGGAARRIARAVFLGSSTQKAVRGITARQVNLGVTTPGQGTAIYGEALREMDGQLYHFYRGNDDRYYFDAQENLNKVANDRANNFSIEAADQEIIRRLAEFRSNNQDRAVSVCQQPPDDVGDDDHVRLVILSPRQSRSSRAAEQDYASETANLLLATGPRGMNRNKPNTVLFLAAASDDVRDMRKVACRFLAWDSIINRDQRVRGLTGERRILASNQQRAADDATRTALANAYRWIMAPVQPDPLNAAYDTDQWKQIGANPDIAANAFDEFRKNQQLLDKLTPTALEHRLREYIWNGPNPRSHLTVAELWNILTSNVYLRLRLRNRQVLEQCLSEGIANGVFARADAYDAAAGKYHNISPRVSEPNASYLPSLSNSTLIVEAGAAEKDQTSSDTLPRSATDTSPSEEQSSGNYDPHKTPTTQREPAGPRRFVARKTVTRYEFPAYDFNAVIREEMARTMADGGGDVVVEITITGRRDDGFPENIVRSLRDNSKALGIYLEEDPAD